MCMLDFDGWSTTRYSTSRNSLKNFIWKNNPVYSKGNQRRIIIILGNPYISQDLFGNTKCNELHRNLKDWKPHTRYQKTISGTLIMVRSFPEVLMKPPIIVKLQSKSLDLKLTLFYPCHNKNNKKKDNPTKYLHCYWPDFDKTLKVGSWKYLE